MFKLNLETIVGLARLLPMFASVYQEIKAAHAQAKVTIEDASGRTIAPEELDAAIGALLLKGYGIGDDAIARLEARG